MSSMDGADTNVRGAAASAGSKMTSAAGGAAAPRAGAGGAAGAATAGAKKAPAVNARGRRVKLTVSRIDPWSAMKMSFLLSVAIGIAMVVMIAVLWTILAGMGVFDQVDSVVGEILRGSSDAAPFSILDFIGFGRVVSLSIVIAVLDVLIMTALATLGAFLYNVCSALVGGLQLTLTDD